MYACEVMIICRQDVRPSERCRFGFQTALGLSIYHIRCRAESVSI
ncbi:hypothetical protein NEISUBOT_03377 [Neisseria subflava NJ9703]|uniref:Uncharacterized protein n=1 Tax=Neisseria subflava NJ9703 TaxID=546268 RepID=A0A9W5N0K9_NEISU|nr:hypothetical protein NEISUBOT_03377 [Neisseria subflava NJ9703]